MHPFVLVLALSAAPSPAGSCVHPTRTGTFTLRLERVALDDALTQLSRATGWTWQAAPGLKLSVNLESAGPVSAEKLVEGMLVGLRAAGLELVQSGDRCLVVHQEGAALHPRVQVIRGGAGWVARPL